MIELGYLTIPTHESGDGFHAMELEAFVEHFYKNRQVDSIRFMRSNPTIFLYSACCARSTVALALGILTSRSFDASSSKSYHSGLRS